MKKLFLLILVATLFANYSYGQLDLDYYLPAGVSYNSEIPTPEFVIGFQVGQWHVSHDKLVQYMYKLAESSDRITIREYARTFENRPLVVLTITSSENQQKIDQIKAQHQLLTDPQQSSSLDLNTMPAVAYMGYSIHGNEASGSNASLLVAYYLAAAQGDKIDQLLSNTIILLDPSFNPDGLNRFASWVNSHKSMVETSDPNNMEQNEAWPGGRTNHYWFDLNRDWLPIQLPESQGRIKTFHDWKPNVLTDHHEMGTNATFFFQPGIPSRNNPLTPDNTYRLTEKMGEYHAKALDSIGSLYYTKESYDDYYYGKGSTYPDVNGAVGILFEQASARGHAQDSENGILRFPFAIKNHFNTSLSTLEALNNMRVEFLNHQRSFYKNALNEAEKDDNQAYVFASNDHTRARELAELSVQHDIEIFTTGKKTNIEGQTFEAGEAYIIPLRQKQYRLIKAMFEKRTSFQDSLFYDVSTWTLPLAFGVEYNFIGGRAYSNDLIGERLEVTRKKNGAVIGGKSDYAYVFEWTDYNAPKALYHLLSRQYKLKVATEPFYHPDGMKFERGSLLLPVSIQHRNSETIFEELKSLAKNTGIDFYAFNTGLDYKGKSLGSRSFESVTKPRTMILVDGGVRSYDAGEVWHLFDQRYQMDLSLVPIDEFNRISLDKYNTIIMVDGNYSDISENGREKLKNWVRDGGSIVAVQRALTYLNNIGLGKFDMKKQDAGSESSSKRYADIQRFRGAQQIGGAIFEVKIDTTNPLFYGYFKSKIPVFRNSELFMEKSKNEFGNPAIYTENPLLSGYISDENLNLLKNSAAVGTVAYGRGRIIGLVDNPNFRAFWYGTNKLFINAIFFGHLINSSASR